MQKEQKEQANTEVNPQGVNTLNASLNPPREEKDA